MLSVSIRVAMNAFYPRGPGRTIRDRKRRRGPCSRRGDTLDRVIRASRRSHRHALLLALSLAGGVAGCNVLTGASELEIADDGIDLPARTEGGSDGASPSAEAGPLAWAHRRAVTLTSDAPAALSGHPTLLTLPATFDYARTLPGAADLRFSSGPDHHDDLDFYVERWTPGGESLVWIAVPAVPPGTSVVHMFYGNANATDASSFERTFPRARRTEGGGKGSFAASGTLDVDWFELRAGDTLTLRSGAPLRITAQRIVIDGTIDGVGRGHPGGALPGPGEGPGGGQPAPDASGAGGGGHGGKGGAGGTDTAGNGGPGGAVNGSETDDAIGLGSGGGSTTTRAGGAGGGALSLVGWVISATGAIRLDGEAGAGLAGQNGGGGAGGGLLVAGHALDLDGATLSATGGAGGPCANAGNDGGGGGGGGRVKIRHRAGGLYAPATISVSGGKGGDEAGTTAPGETGSRGTVHVSRTEGAVRGVDAALGPEEPTR
jgi:hypothetical protein